MYGSFSHRRIALVVALAVLGVAWLATAAQAGNFQASGTYVITSIHGNVITIAQDGRANPGGPFTGPGEIKVVADGGRQYGPVTFDFGSGDTLTLFTFVEPNSTTGDLVGAYVVIGGTGKLADATGSGDLTVVPAGNAGTFEFVGTLSH